MDRWVEFRGLGVSLGRSEGRLVFLSWDHLGDEGEALLPESAVLWDTMIPPQVSRLSAKVCGLVIEEGGMLSHGATLAREMRIPCVVGVRLKGNVPAGTVVVVDGAAGLVRAKLTPGDP
ncbi:MAG: hypothetical protein CL878_15650 [Dehalococcoidia bacterium]|nr:hypothetical protein [Dehalococcoidia bacterium]